MWSSGALGDGTLAGFNRVAHDTPRREEMT